MLRHRARRTRARAVFGLTDMGITPDSGRITAHNNHHTTCAAAPATTTITVPQPPSFYEFTLEVAATAPSTRPMWSILISEAIAYVRGESSMTRWSPAR